MKLALLGLAAAFVWLTPQAEALEPEQTLVAYCVRIDGDARLAIWKNTQVGDFGIQTSGDLSLEYPAVWVSEREILVQTKSWGGDFTIPRGKSEVEIFHQPYNCDY